MCSAEFDLITAQFAADMQSRSSLCESFIIIPHSVPKSRDWQWFLA